MWRVVDQTITEARSSFADRLPEESQAIIDKATGQVRDEIHDWQRQDRRP